jgi:hypothetical protein
MLEFQLFRIKVYPSQQGQLFVKEKTRPAMLQETIESLPSAVFRTGLTWHIGNVTPIDKNGLYLRLGRTSTSTLEIYDEQDGDFLDQEFETAPYTHVIVDVEMEICVIAKKTRLAPATVGIAKQFVRLLNESEKAIEFQATFEIDDVKDPEDFISQLKEAYSISKFWVLFSRENAFDAHEDFVKPFQKMVEKSKSEKGKAELKGKNLDSTTLEAVARSAAATGDDAGAWLKPNRHSGRVKKRLKGNPVNISQEDVRNDEERQTLIKRARELYHSIRGDGK